MKQEAAPALRTQTTLKQKKSALKLLVSDISDQDTVTRLHRAVNSKSDSLSGVQFPLELTFKKKSVISTLGEFVFNPC